MVQKYFLQVFRLSRTYIGNEEEVIQHRNVKPRGDSEVPDNFEEAEVGHLDQWQPREEGRAVNQAESTQVMKIVVEEVGRIM